MLTKFQSRLITAALSLLPIAIIVLLFMLVDINNRWKAIHKAQAESIALENIQAKLEIMTYVEREFISDSIKKTLPDSLVIHKIENSRAFHQNEDCNWNFNSETIDTSYED